MNEGRWPANVILSPSAAATLDEQSGPREGGHWPKRRNADTGRAVYGEFTGQGGLAETRHAEGGASRFFLTAGYEPWELEWIIANGLTPCGT